MATLSMIIAPIELLQRLRFKSRMADVVVAVKWGGLIPYVSAKSLIRFLALS